MIRKAFVLSAVALAGMATLSMPAQAATSIVDGSCVSVYDTHGCLFNGNINKNINGGNSFLLAEAAYNLYNDTHPSANPDIDLHVLFATDSGFPGTGTFLGGGTTSGSWSLPGYLIDFVAIKASDQFVIYGFNSPVSSANWSTIDIPGGHAISHIVFFGSRTVVPEPASWAMMIAGFGLIGGFARRRAARISANFA